MAKAKLLKTINFNSPADDLPTAVECFISYCRAKNLSDNTIGYYGYRLQAFSRYLTKASPGCIPSEITPQLIRSFISNETRH
ncbi:MAG TPA: site-specific integrase, partial [Bacteroidales bacterium]|nr:site-specific integrase [Bacteroidales bacterium]